MQTYWIWQPWLFSDDFSSSFTIWIDTKNWYLLAKSETLIWHSSFRYYGYRNPHNETDHRLRVFSHHSYLFESKDILDIGCNIGHVTLSVARDFGAKSILGIDIDPKLISIARKNVKHYVKKEELSPPKAAGGEDKGRAQARTKSSEFFPISMPILYGGIAVPGFHDTHAKAKGFPNNVTFKQVSTIFCANLILLLK